MQLPSADANPNSAEITALHSHLVALGWVSARSHIEGLSSPGAGNMNRTLRIHLQGHSTPTLILKQSVPYVAKYPDIPAPITRDQSEAAFYQGISTNPNLAERCPQLHGHDQANHVLCFEDLGAGLDFTHLYPQDLANTAGPVEAYQPALADLLEWLSQLHLTPLSKSATAAIPSNTAMRKLNHEHIFALPFTASNGFAEFEEVGAWQAELIQDPQLLQRIEALGNLYLDTANATLESSVALLHGDFYPGSWLQAGTAPDQVKIIDPEFSFVGPAEFDLGVFSAHLTFAGWTSTARVKLLQNYQPPANFSLQLAEQFAAVEIMRRLLGVAKLPMQTSAATQISWLSDAANVLRQPL